MDATTILIVILAAGWARSEWRTRALVLELRALIAESRSGVDATGRVVAEARAALLEMEIQRLHGVGRELRAVFIRDVSPVLQSARVQSDRLPGLLADVAGERHGLCDSEPGDRH